jgi:hypothetical protein
MPPRSPFKVSVAIQDVIPGWRKQLVPCLKRAPRASLLIRLTYANGGSFEIPFDPQQVAYPDEATKTVIPGIDGVQAFIANARAGRSGNLLLNGTQHLQAHDRRIDWAVDDLMYVARDIPLTEELAQGLIKASRGTVDG